MTVACYLDPNPEKAELLSAFAQGCGGALIRSAIPEIHMDDHAVVAKGIAKRLVPTFKRLALDFWYLDSAYIQIPGQRYCRIERNGYWPNWARVWAGSEPTLERAEQHGWTTGLNPWRTDGNHVLLCFPGPGAGSDFGINMRAWWEDVRRRLARATKRPIKERHKHARESKPLAEDLEDAWCVVTHSSTAAVEAAIAGVPVFCEPTCAAAPIGRTDMDIENPVRPDRESWLAALAWRQFSRDDLRSGFAWEIIKARE